MVVLKSLLYQLNNIIVAHFQEIIHPFPITARRVAPSIGFDPVKSCDDGDRISYQFEQPIEIALSVAGFLIHLVLNLS
jgi:hypothetical protein